MHKLTTSWNQCTINLMYPSLEMRCPVSTSATFGLFLALNLECCTNLLPATDSNNRGYYNPGGICTNIVCVIVIWTRRKVITVQVRSYEIHSSSIELPQWNSKLKDVAIWLSHSNSIPVKCQQTTLLRIKGFKVIKDNPVLFHTKTENESYCAAK